jgi:hypothetical protein
MSRVVLASGHSVFNGLGAELQKPLLTQMTQIDTDELRCHLMLKCLERRELISRPGIPCFWFFKFDSNYYQRFDVSRSLAVPSFNPNH